MKSRLSFQGCGLNRWLKNMRAIRVIRWVVCLIPTLWISVSAQALKVASHHQRLCDPSGPTLIVLDYPFLTPESIPIRKINGDIKKSVLSNIAGHASASLEPCRGIDPEGPESADILEINSTIDMNLKDLAYVEILWDSEGGAHGSGGGKSFYASLETGDRLKTQDIFTAVGLQRVNRLIDQKLMAMGKEEGLSSCHSGFTSLDKQGMFRFSADTLTVSFLKDELDSNCGFIDATVKIPMTQIKALLQPSFVSKI